jgi:hypothetical protein
MNSKEVIVIENGSSGKMYNEKFVRNNYTSVYDDVMEYSSLELSDLPFKEKVYHYVNNLPDRVYCSNPNCNNLTTFKNSTLGYNKYCSIKCISSDPKVKETKERKSFEKFGTKAPAMNNDIKNKIILTNNKKYGYNSPMQNKDIQEKSKDTLIKNYGVDNPAKSKYIYEKIKKTNINRLGVDNPKKNIDINNKIKKTMLERYGVENALQNKDIKSKSKEKQMLTLAKKIKEYYKEYDIINIDSKNKKYKIKCKNNHVFEIDYTLLNSRRRINTLVCTECNPLNKSISGLEIELIQFIKENYKDDIFLNDRLLINKELDIYLPNIKLAFEFNGLWWHNETNKPRDYHLNKTDECEKVGVKLVHVWEDDWIYRKDIVKSMIINMLNSTKNRIFARKCNIKLVSNELSKKFLDDNHIQGGVNSTVNIGLYYNNEIVSLMNFGKKRVIMNDRSGVDEWELIRFCNKIDTSVVGGASKLFKYFVDTYKPKEVITYANRSYSNGELYKKLNFCFIHKTNINYYYVVNKIRKHRFSFRKSKLVKDGFDSNKTEHEIMLERKIYRIYDSGQLKFIWKQE